MIVEHHIQRQILRELVKGEYRRYSDLKPKDIESNLFMYHLKQLTRAGFVTKNEQGYTLTKQGRQHADRSNLPSMKLRLQPKQITVLVVKSGKKYVLLRRTHVPYMNCSGFPSGKLHYGEELMQSAHRELKEKTGIDDVDLTFRGNLLMRFYDAQTGDISSHINAYIFSGITRLDELSFQSEFFNSYIGDESELYAKKAFKGHKEIVELLQKNPQGIFFAEERFISDF